MRQIYTPFVRRDACHEHEAHKFTAEASELCLPVGRFPESMATDLGNGQTLIATACERDAEGDILSVSYRQSLGCISLTIFND